MATNCIITFDHLNRTYNSGEVLNGHVKLEIPKLKSIRGISINIVGFAKISWREPGGKHSRIYSAREQYINSNTYVIGSFEGNSFNLAPGVYNYSFSCALPKELPTSVDIDGAGKVKYKTIVTIERPFKLANVFKMDFSVNHISDLNCEPGNKLPRRSYFEKHISPLFGLCCCGGGDVRAQLEISRGGYVPGENVFYKLNIYNDSNIDLSDARIKLIKCYTFTSSEPSERQKEVPENVAIIKTTLNQIPRKSRREFKDSFQLPYLTPTHRTNNVRVDYNLRVKIPLGCNSLKKFSIQIPITVGTLPIAGNTIQYNGNLSNIAHDIVPNSTNLNTLVGNSNNRNDNIRSYNNYSSENSINPNNVTTMKSTAGVSNNESCMTYGWN